MTWEPKPPTPEISDDLPAVRFFANDDGSYWVPIEDEPDERRAWERLEASISMPLFPGGRQDGVSTNDCEWGHDCTPLEGDEVEEGDGWCDSHPDCPRSPCPEPTVRDCWTFEDAETQSQWREGALYAWTTAELGQG